jgi:hypothetical protein
MFHQIVASFVSDSSSFVQKAVNMGNQIGLPGPFSLTKVARPLKQIKQRASYSKTTVSGRDGALVGEIESWYSIHEGENDSRVDYSGADDHEEVNMKKCLNQFAKCYLHGDSYVFAQSDEGTFGVDPKFAELNKKKFSTRRHRSPEELFVAS